RLDSADSRALTRGQDLDLIADDEATFDERAGDHRAEAGQCEGPVDRKARAAEIATRRCTPEHGLERGDQLSESGLRRRGDLDHRRATKWRSLKCRGDV